MGGPQQQSPTSSTKAGGDQETTLLNNINMELKALYNYLEKHQVSGAEMDRLLEPLVTAVEGGGGTAPSQELPQPSSATVTTSPTTAASWFILTIVSLWTRFKSYHKTLLCCFLLVVSGYIVMQVPQASKLVIVLLRHLQIMILPYWDWSHLYYSECVLTNPFYVRQPLTASDCNVCESVDTLDALSSVSVSVATDEYLRDDRPFIVTDAMDNWPVMNTDDFWFDNITEVYQSPPLSDVYPCELTTNLRVPPDDLQTFLTRVHMPAVDRWYGHWENCNKRAAKALRAFYQRPYFMPHMVDFSDTNWVLMSSDYKAKVYKEVLYQSEVLWFAALRGWWHVRVVPLEPCNQHCPELTATIMEGHMVVVTNRLWKLEYIPGEETDNLAIAVGGFWN